MIKIISIINKVLNIFHMYLVVSRVVETDYSTERTYILIKSKLKYEKHPSWLRKL